MKRKHLLTRNITILYLFFMVPIYAQNYTTATIISNSGLTLRESCSTKGRKILVIPATKRVYIISKKNNDYVDGISDFWYYVTYDKYQGCLFGGYLQLSNDNGGVGYLFKSVNFYGNGVTEYLYEYSSEFIHEYYYYTSKAPKKIKLRILNKQDTFYDGKSDYSRGFAYTVKFPDRKNTYILIRNLVMDNNSLTCINPDKSEQEFEYVYINQ